LPRFWAQKVTLVRPEIIQQSLFNIIFEATITPNITKGDFPPNRGLKVVPDMLYPSQIVIAITKIDVARSDTNIVIII